ncbi:MAG: phosphotransferase [Christensenellales bacterium]|jgi:hypothetical protein
MIEPQLLGQLNITHYSVAEQYFSRRNAVYRIDAARPNGDNFMFVYKTYVCGDAGREADNLGRLQKKKVPRILARGNKALCLEYIKGPTLLKYLEDAERCGKTFSHCVDMFIDFLIGCYEEMPGMIYGDVNLRNFIVTKHGVAGVDLEEAGPGLPAADIGRAAAFIPAYYPAGTEYKKAVAKYLIKKGAARLGIAEQDIRSEADKERADMRIRRYQKIVGVV